MSGSELQGFTFPRSATGAAGLVPPPPWHYSGDLLTIEYRTDPEAVAELLPPPLEPAPEDPGAVAVVCADHEAGPPRRGRAGRGGSGLASRDRAGRGAPAPGGA